eukprot:6466433-Amphidinium_carterae.1
MWEKHLVARASDIKNVADHTGSAVARRQYRQPTAQREQTQLHSAAEKALWRLLGLMQGVRQGRLVPEGHIRRTAERLHREQMVKRSLPPLQWESLEACAELESALKTAIQSERHRRITARRSAWRDALHEDSGNNALARKMVRGVQPGLLLLQHDGKQYTCPAMQCEVLERAWADIGQGKEDLPIHPDILNAVVRAECKLPRISASDVVDQ